MPLPKKPPLLLTVGTAFVLIGGGAAAYFALSRRGPAARYLPTGAQVIPETTLATVTVSTDEGEWRRLRQFGTAETQADFDQQLANWRDRILASNGYDFERDIAPWVGDSITLALMPEVIPTEEDSDAPPAENGAITPAPANSGDAPLLIVLPIDNVEQAQALADLPSPPDQDWQEREYRGITIRELQAEGDRPSLSAAALGAEWVVVSTHGSTTDAAVDAYRGATSLADLPGVAPAFSQIAVNQPFAKVFVNGPAARSATATQSDPAVPPALLSQLEDYQGFAGAITLEASGLRLQGMGWLANNSDRTFSATNTPGTLPRALPDNTLVMASGGDFQKFWEDYRDRSRSADGFSPISPDNLQAGLQTLTGLDIETDLLPWMAGEFAVGMVAPDPDDQPPPLEGTEDLVNPDNLRPGLVLMVNTNNRREAERTLDRLGEVLTSRYRFQVNNDDVNGEPVTRWVSPFAALTLSSGWLPGDTLFLAVSDTLPETLLPQPPRSLADTSLFQTTTAQAPSNNNGHFFINFEGLNAARGSALLPELPPDQQQITTAINGIGVTTTIEGSRSLRYDLYVALQRGSRPGALPPAETDEAEAEDNGDDEADDNGDQAD